MVAITDLLALVVCTKDRPERVRDFVINLLSEAVPPVPFVLVDSTKSLSGQTTNKDSLDLLRQHDWEVKYVFDNPGLPHQRNTGIEQVVKSFPSVEFISFLDDDVRISKHYFTNVLNLFRIHEELGVLGGYDTTYVKPRGNFIRSFLRKLGLLPESDGLIAKSGLSSVPIPTSELHLVDFVPGGMQSIRISLLGEHRFNEESSFYGEDVEMHFRLGKLCKIASSNSLPVEHLAAKEEKSDNGNQIYSEYLVRMRLHLLDPHRVRFFHMLIVGNILLMADVANCLAKLQLADGLSSGFHHFRGIIKIISIKLQLSSMK